MVDLVERLSISVSAVASYKGTHRDNLDYSLTLEGGKYYNSYSC